MGFNVTAWAFAKNVRVALGCDQTYPSFSPRSRCVPGRGGPVPARGLPPEAGRRWVVEPGGIEPPAREGRNHKTQGFDFQGFDL